MTYFFDIEKCKTCSRREGCYKVGAKSKTYSIPIRNEEQKRQLGFQKSQEFKDIARQRYKIEAKNAELKQVYGYDKALSYGLDGMQMASCYDHLCRKYQENIETKLKTLIKITHV